MKSFNVFSTRPIRHSRIVLAVLVLLGSVAVARACQTPVYRYAMYNWRPAMYRVYYLHEGKAGAEDEKANRLLAGLAESGPKSTNVAFLSVDVLKKDELSELPDVVRTAWQSLPKPSKPVHLVFTPFGDRIFSGRLDAAVVDAMAGSPARTRLTELFGEGQSAVLLLVAGKDAAQNAAAERTIGELIRRVERGELPAESGIDAGLGAPSDKPPAKFKLALIKLARDDPREQWLVRCLLTMGADLPKRNEPMVFAVFGRARALDPLVGKGINPENLTACVEFLAGACSCMVKEENPGMDLLASADWTALAESIAAKAGDTEDYQPFQTSDSLVPAADKAAVAEPARAKAAAANSPALSRVSPPSVRVAVEPVQPDSPDSTFGSRLVRQVGLGAAAAMVVLVLVGSLWFRRRGQR
ncbi:MAG: hypothetical protein ACYC35_28070 [Pirellulales bacterium]